MLRAHPPTHSPRPAPLLVGALVAALLAPIGSCGDAPTAVRTTARTLSPAASPIADVTPATVAAAVRVCNQGAAATYTTTARIGEVVPIVSLMDGQCATVWHASRALEVVVTVSRNGNPALQTDAIVQLASGVATVRYNVARHSVSGRVGADLVFFNTRVGADPWQLTKSLIKKCEDYNAWLAQVKAALQAYLATLTGSEAQIRATRAVVERALEELSDCTNDADLGSKKEIADLLLRPIDIIKASAKLWNSGFQLYAVAIDLIIKSLSDPVGVPFELINKTLDFLITGAEAVGNREGAQKLRDVKALKERVERGVDTVGKLKEALEAVRPFTVSRAR